MKLIRLMFAAGVAAGCYAAPAVADGVPKFGKTCLGNVGRNTNVCISSNGTSLASTYNWRGNVPTQGKHSGCKLSGSTINCSGGTYSTSQGSGRMDPISVKVSGGKPISLRWN